MITAPLLLAVVGSTAVVLTNESIKPPPQTVPDKVFVLVCGEKQTTVLTNVKEIPPNCKLIKQYDTPKK